MRAQVFDRLSFWSLFLILILLPFFFLPFTNVSVETSKGLLVVVGICLCVIFWALARFFDGKVTLPKSNVLIGAAGVVLILFLSSVLSQNPQVSFFGTMFDPGSFYFIFTGFVLMLCASVVPKTMRQVRMILFGAVLSSAIVLIFQSLRLVLPGLIGWIFPNLQSGFLFDLGSLSLGVLAGKTDNVLGSWNSLGFFAGFSGLLYLLIVEFFQVNRLVRWVLGILTGVSVLFIAIVNFQLVWVPLGISALVIFIYKISVNGSRDKIEDTSENAGRKVYFPAFSFMVIIVSLFFFVSGAFVGDILPSRLGVGNNEISPTLSSTVTVAKSVLKTNPVFGIGPNGFTEAWAKYKPAVVSTTAFGDSVFNSGSGLIPTIVSTTGYLGILAWLVFFVLLIMSGGKSVFSGTNIGSSASINERLRSNVNWETIAFFIMSLYLFVSAFLHPAGSVVFFLAFAFAGVFIGLSTGSRPNGEMSFSLLSDHRKSFFSLLFIIVLIIVSAAIAFKYTERFAGALYFEKARAASNVPEAVTAIGKAVTLNANDQYLRTYAQIYLVQFGSLMVSGAGEADLQASLDQVISSAQAAISYNPQNYLNYETLGSAFKVFGNFGVKDAYDKAVEVYKKASELNPLSPGLKLEISNALLGGGKIAEAKEYADAALTLKPDYINAFLMLSQIARKDGNNSEALSYARKALALAPENEELIKYVDSLKSGDSGDPVPDVESDNKKP